MPTAHSTSFCTSISQTVPRQASHLSASLVTPSHQGQTVRHVSAPSPTDHCAQHCHQCSSGRVTRNALLTSEWGAWWLPEVVCTERYWAYGASLEFAAQLVGCGSHGVDSTEQGTDNCGFLCIHTHTYPMTPARDVRDPRVHRTRAEIQSRGQ